MRLALDRAADFGWARRRAYLPAVMLAGAVLMIARRPQVLTAAEFRVEDGQTFFLGTYFGSPIEGVLRPYQGYLHVVTRLVALLERLPPIQFAPLVANVAAIAIAVAVAGYVASGRLSAIVPDPRVRLALGALVLFVPGAAELTGSMTYAQWFLDVFLIAAALAAAPSSRPGRVAEFLALGLGGLTGPAILLIAPLHVVAAAASRSRWRIATAAVTTAAAIVQVAVLLTSSREAPGGGTLTDAATLVVARSIVEPVLGARIVGIASRAGLTLGLAAVIIGGLVVAMRDLPRRWLGVLWYLWISFVAAALIGSLAPFSALLNPNGGQRYFFVPGLVIGALIILAATRRRGPISLALAVLLLVGVVADFRMKRIPTHHWAAESACIGGVDPCRVPVEPTRSWTIHWPGLGGQYDQNRAFEP